MNKPQKNKTFRSGKIGGLLSSRFGEFTESAELALNQLDAPAASEAVHELRVGLRNLCVLLCLFPHHQRLAQQRHQMRRLAKLTGNERDSEVAVRLAEILFTETGAGKEQIAFLTHQCDIAREKRRDELDIQRFCMLLTQSRCDWQKKIQAVPKRTLFKAANHRLRQHEKCMRKQAASLQLTSSVADWHNFRLLVKKVRYWQESFVGLLGKQQLKKLPELIQLQQRLGLLHDYYLLETQLVQHSNLPESWGEKLTEHRQLILQEAVRRLPHLTG